MVFRSALVKVVDFDGALLLATNEYPVSWMAPESAAIVGLTVEIITPILLIIGLLTRSAGIALFALFAVSHFAYQPIDFNLFVMTLLLLLIVRGSGAFSFDRLLARGIEDNAFPIAPTAVKIGALSRQYGLPLLLLVFRTWLAFTLLIGANFIKAPLNYNIFPFGTFSHIPQILLIIFAVLAIIGLALPIMVIGLIVTVSDMQILDAIPVFSLFALFLFLFFLSSGQGVSVLIVP